MNDVNIPIPTVCVGIAVSVTSRIFSATAPSIAGIESRKEYSAAVFAEIPKNSASDIVVPEREMPGVIAHPCITPMSGACHVFNAPFEELAPSEFSLRSRGTWRTTPVRINIILTIWTLSKKDSNCVLNRIAMIPVGIDPSRINPMNLSSVDALTVAKGFR